MPLCRPGILQERTDRTSHDLYQYDSLETTPSSIRLIKLLPATYSEPLRCSIITISLKDRPRYEALSYVWGDQSSTENAYCTSCTGSGIIKIRENLAFALRHVRNRYRSRMVYADAISINQQDVNERASQVLLMADIYRLARRVLIWLGTDAEFQANLAFTWIRGYGKYAKKQWRRVDSSTFPDFIPLDDDWGMGPPSPQVFDAIANVLHRPWFYRIWVLQEAALARDALILCGSSKLKLQTLMCFVDAARRNVSEEVSHLNVLFIENTYSQLWAPYGTTASWMRKLPFDPAYQLQEGRNKLPLGDLMRMTLTRFATDQRDRVYALLSHPAFWTGGKNDPLVMPDYEVDFIDLCARTMIAAVTKKQDLSMLSLVSHGPGNQSPFEASWIPNLTIKSNIIDYLFFSAGLNNEPNATITGNRLCCDGILVDTVSCPMKTFPYTKELESDDGASRFITILGHLLYMAPRPSQTSGYTDLSKIKYLACLLLCPPQPRADLVAWKRDFAKDVRNLKDFIDWEMPDLDDDWEDEYQSDRDLYVHGFQEKTIDYFDKMFRYCSNRRVFRTVGGLWGLGPGPMVDGDACCVLNGTRVPYILRPRANGEHEFLGECYVPGLMFGEIGNMIEKGQAWAQRFTLR